MPLAPQDGGLLPSCQAIALSLVSGQGIAMQMGIAIGMGIAMGMGRLRPVLMCPYLPEMHHIQQK